MNAYSYKREIKVIITRNVSRAHVCSGRSSTPKSKPSVEGEDSESGHDREVRVADIDSVLEDGESESRETTSEVDMPVADATTPITSGRAPSFTSRAGKSKSGGFLDPESMINFGEGLANASTAASISNGPDKPKAALSVRKS